MEFIYRGKFRTKHTGRNKQKKHTHQPQYRQPYTEKYIPAIPASLNKCTGKHQCQYRLCITSQTTRVTTLTRYMQNNRSIEIERKLTRWKISIRVKLPVVDFQTQRKCALLNYWEYNRLNRTCRSDRV